MTTVSAVYLISEQDTDFVIEKTRTIPTGIVPRFLLTGISGPAFHDVLPYIR